MLYENKPRALVGGRVKCLMVNIQIGITEKCFATKRWQLFSNFIPQTRNVDKHVQKSNSELKERWEQSVTTSIVQTGLMGLICNW